MMTQKWAVTEGDCDCVSGGKGDRKGAVCGGDRRDGDAAEHELPRSHPNVDDRSE